MRFRRKAVVFMVSTGSVLTSAGAAQAQFASPPGPLGSYANYIIGNLPDSSNSCPALTGVKVTVRVTQDIVVASSACPNSGFSLQLNANAPAPSTNLTSAQALWQQFVFDMGQSFYGVRGHTQEWPNNSLDVDPTPSPFPPAQ